MESRMNDSMTTSNSMQENTMSQNQNLDVSVNPRHSTASCSSISSSISQQTNDSGISISSGQLTFSQNQCIERDNFPFVDNVEKYKKIAKIGHGTYGEVFKAFDPTNKQFVALKRVLDDHGKFSGFPITTLREIRILQQIKHVNVVKLIEICRSKPIASNRYRSNFYLVFEFCEHDLGGLLSNKNVRFNLGEIKSVVQQLLNGLYFLHYCKIMHRDLKPANILGNKIPHLVCYQMQEKAKKK